MASNLLADRARRFRVRTQFLEMVGRADDIGIDPIDPFRIVAGRTELERLETAIGALPDRTRTIFVLFRRSEEHTSELQSLMRISYAVFCLNKKTIPYTLLYILRFHF